MNEKYILLVEDDPNDELLTLHALQENRIRNKVIVTRDGAEALDYLFSTGPRAGKPFPDLPQFVLLDLKLPKIDGIEVLQALRAHPRTHLLPVIIFTSSKQEKDMINGYRLGANSYVRKPVDFTEFANAVKELDLYWMVLNEKAPDPA
jgi:two-component system response regulator